MPLLTAENRRELAHELKRMFELHDRKPDQDRITLFIEELEKSKLPFGAIMAAIREISLSDEVKQLKIGALFVKAREFVEPTAHERTPCDDCQELGVVLMEDDNRCSFAFACRCPNGARFRKGDDRLTLWNGENIQFNARQKRFTLKFQKPVEA